MAWLFFACIGAAMFFAASVLGKNKPKDVAKDTAKGCLVGIGGGYLILLLIFAGCALIWFFLKYGLYTMLK